jgi:hypothetical protein
MYEVVPFSSGTYRLLAAGEDSITNDSEYFKVDGISNAAFFYEKRNDEEFLNAFNTAIYDAADNGYEVVWVTDYKPLNIEYQPYDLLYPLESVTAPTESTYSLSQYFNPDANKEDNENLIHGYTEIQVDYNHNFDKALGLLIYDYDENLSSYTNCIASLRAIDKEIRETLSSYLLVYYGLYLS